MSWTLTNSWAKRCKRFSRCSSNKNSTTSPHTNKHTHTQHPNIKTRLQFPFGSSQMASCDLTEGEWTSWDRPKLLDAWLTPPARSLNSVRELWVTRTGKGWVMYGRSRSAVSPSTSPILNHITHIKPSAWAQPADRVCESAAVSLILAGRGGGYHGGLLQLYTLKMPLWTLDVPEGG